MTTIEEIQLPKNFEGLRVNLFTCVFPICFRPTMWNQISPWDIVFCLELSEWIYITQLPTYGNHKLWHL